MSESVRQNFVRTHRRGSVYAMVLGIAMLITVIGIGALATARVTTRGATVSADWQEAGAIAFSAVEHAVAKMNAEGTANPTTWRTPYTSGAVAFNQPFGRGRLRWVLEDETDGSISNDYAQPFKIYGVGRVGSTTRVYSATLLPGGAALDVLRTACHSNEELKIKDVIVAYNGPISTNGDLNTTGGATLRGSSEVAGAGGTSSPVKTMPSATVFELYGARATPIPVSAISGGSFAPPGGLTADNNPYGDENAEGIYLLTIPDTIAYLEIQSCRIKGTLLISGAATRTDQVVAFNGAMLLEPHRVSLPTVITKRINQVIINGSVAQFTESGTTYPSEIRGLVHCIGTSKVYLMNGTYVVGTVVCDGRMELNGTVGFTVDPRLAAQPPLGYTQGNQMFPAPGSWKWDAPPAGAAN